MYRTNKAIQPLLFIALTLASCSQPATDQKSSTEQPPVATVNYQKPQSSFNDTLIVEAPAAVFYYADSLQLTKIKAQRDPQKFEADMHEFVFLIKTAKKVIGSNMPKLPITEAKNKRYLLFIGEHGFRSSIDLDGLPDACGLIICDKDKKPQPVDMANTDSEIGFYFSK